MAKPIKAQLQKEQTIKNKSMYNYWEDQSPGLVSPKRNIALSMFTVDHLGKGSSYPLSWQIKMNKKTNYSSTKIFLFLLLSSGITQAQIAERSGLKWN